MKSDFINILIILMNSYYSDFNQYESCRRYSACGVCNKCNPSGSNSSASSPITADQTLFSILYVFILWTIVGCLYLIVSNETIKTILYICFIIQTAIIVFPFVFLYLIIKLIFSACFT